MDGKIFGRYTVIGRAPRKGKSREARWLCRCECGTEKTVSGGALRNGAIKSCGCLNRELSKARATKHGGSRTKMYQRWYGMKERCSNSNTRAYPNYGGRGIYVCERWMSFESFREDMGDPPTPKHTIERVDNSGPYSPENCRWATRKEQAQNMRKTHLITYDGLTLSLREWSRRLDLPHGTLSYRARRGWSDWEVLFGK